MVYLFAVYLFSWTQVIFAYVNDTHWLVIQNDRIPIKRGDFIPVAFNKHPKRNGRKLSSTYPALYLQDRQVVFGQTEESNNGGFCASFNFIGSKTLKLCKNFRVLKSLEEDQRDYYLIKPELFDPFLDDPVGFDDRFLVVAYDLYADSSFFGTLHRPMDGGEPVVYAVDYDGAPVEMRGTSATLNGEFIVFVARQRPFFQPLFEGICRPIASLTDTEEAPHQREEDRKDVSITKRMLIV